MLYIIVGLTVGLSEGILVTPSCSPGLATVAGEMGWSARIMISLLSGVGIGLICYRFCHDFELILGNYSAPVVC